MQKKDLLYRELQQKIEYLGEVPCENIPDAYFHDEDQFNAGELNNIAKSLCESCPVRMLCLEYSLEADEEFGIWGGLTPGARRVLKRRRVSAR